MRGARHGAHRRSGALKAARPEALLAALPAAEVIRGAERWPRRRPRPDRLSLAASWRGTRTAGCRCGSSRPRRGVDAHDGVRDTTLPSTLSRLDRDRARRDAVVRRLPKRGPTITSATAASLQYVLRQLAARGYEPVGLVWRGHPRPLDDLRRRQRRSGAPGTEAAGWRTLEPMVPCRAPRPGINEAASRALPGRSLISLKTPTVDETAGCLND